METMNWENWAVSNAWALTQLAAYISALATVVFVGFRTVKKVGYIYRKIGSPVVVWFTAPGIVLKRLDSIEKQFFPNGGASLVDRVYQLESGVRSIRTEVSRIYQFTMADRESDKTPRLEFDALNRLKWANNSAFAILGVAKQDSVGTGWMAKIHHGYQELIPKEMDRASRDIRSCHIDFVVVKTQSDGTRVTLNLNPLTDENKFVGWTGYMTIHEHTLPQ